MAPRNAGTAVRLGGGLEELEAIAEGVARVDAGVAGQRLVIDDDMAGAAQTRDELGQPIDEEAWMSLARGPEICFHTEMDLHGPVFEPHAPALRELGRLHDLRKPEESRIESPGLLLAACGHGQLH